MGQYLKLHKAKIDPKTRQPYIEFTSMAADADYGDNHKTEFAQPVHKDLVGVLAGLVPHLLIECELTDLKYEHEVIEVNEFLCANTTVTGISWGGTGEHEGVTLVGQKRLKTGKVLNLIAPFCKFDEMRREMQVWIHLAEAELQEYIEGSKRGDFTQLDIDFNPKIE